MDVRDPFWRTRRAARRCADSDRPGLDGDVRLRVLAERQSFTPVSLSGFPSTNPNLDLAGSLPASLVGSVTIRVVDLDRTAGEQTLDTIAVDDLWIRS